MAGQSEYRYITRTGVHINDPVSEFRLYLFTELPEAVQYTGRIIVRVELPEDDTELQHKDYRVGELNPLEFYWSMRNQQWIEF